VLASGIVTGTDLRFYEEFVWQKQTSKLMLGAGRRPRPGNNIACNATERITIYVKVSHGNFLLA